MDTFGQNLKEARKIRKMNQQALGQAIGVGQTTIANYEKGLRFPTGELLKKLAEILNVSIDELLGHSVIRSLGQSPCKDLEECSKLFTQYLVEGREQEAIALIWDLDPSEENLVEIYESIITKAMITLGSLWEQGELTVAEEHFASQVVHKILAMLSTIPAETEKKGKKAICMALSSEAHTIGIKMISEYMNLKGVLSYYIGTEVPTDSLVTMLEKEKADILALSVTMTYQIVNLKVLITALKKVPSLKDLKILVGGQAFGLNEEAAKETGAHSLITGFGSMGQWLEANDMI